MRYTQVKLNLVTMFICSFLLVGCATSPQDDPAYVSPMQYDNYDCSQLKAEMRRVSMRIEQITRSEAAELCRLSPDQAKRLLLRMVDDGQLAHQGAGKGTYYELAPNIRARP